ncbi:hypothetical protein VT930_11985 [Mycobacterium sherrisii]|uniref:hypothetical protein n=1 Tax=Mycobacterium sherrisii TaxID=243061 RepID=UPI002DDDA2D8|nr:hypothetical protein [Mycobacterium sherrisii]MEC4763824.1 hypothetical protein [Mycobacterium sherrisii]
MNIPESRSAAHNVDWITDRDGYNMPREPADPGPVHAWLHAAANPNPPQRSPFDGRREAAQLSRYILSQPGTVLLEYRTSVEAACGSRLHIIYKRPFATDQDNVCERCVEMARLWQNNPAEYHRRVEARHQRREQRRDRRYEELDARDWMRQESYGSDPIDTGDD